MNKPRGRGRPKGRTDTRAKILTAAVEEFGAHGYEGATVRSIATRAHVDSALVHHYFGSKGDLFAEAAEVPLRPDKVVPLILEGPRDEVGERIVRYVLESFERDEVRRRGVMLLRTAVSGRGGAPLIVGFLSNELLPRVAKPLGVPDADLRASLVASQIAGLLMARYVLKVKSLAEAPIDELIARIGPTVQRYLFGEPEASETA